MVQLRDTQLRAKKHNYSLADGEGIAVLLSETGHFEVADAKTAKALCDKYNTGADGQPLEKKRILSEGDEGFGIAAEKQSDKELTRVEVAGLKLDLEARDKEIVDLKAKLEDAGSDEDVTKILQANVDLEEKILKAHKEKTELLEKIADLVTDAGNLESKLKAADARISDLEVKLAKAQEPKQKAETPELPKGKEEAATGGQKEEAKQKAK